MSDAILIALTTAGLNAAVTWGIISTKLEWLRRDVDLAHERLNALTGQPKPHKS